MRSLICTYGITSDNKDGAIGQNAEGGTLKYEYHDCMVNTPQTSMLYTEVLASVARTKAKRKWKQKSSIQVQTNRFSLYS